MYTEQELVNAILFVRNEESTADVTSQNPAVQDARMHLADVNKEFQGRGWWFNKERKRKLLPDSAGIVHIPTETLSWSLTPGVLHTQSPEGKDRYTQRGSKVYDMIKHTYTIGCALTCDLIIKLEYPDLPPTAAVYLKHLAASRAFRAGDGDMQVKRDLDRDVLDAYALLRAEEIRVTGANALDSPSAQNLLSGIRPYGGTNNPRYPGGRNWMR